MTDSERPLPFFCWHDTPCCQGDEAQAGPEASAEDLQRWTNETRVDQPLPKNVAKLADGFSARWDLVGGKLKVFNQFVHNVVYEAQRVKPSIPDAWATGDDFPLAEDEAIDHAYPIESGRHDLYEEAMRLVGAKCSKGALVALVNWLLHQIDDHQKQIIALLPKPKNNPRAELFRPLTAEEWAELDRLEPANRLRRQAVMERASADRLGAGRWPGRNEGAVAHEVQQAHDRAVELERQADEVEAQLNSHQQTVQSVCAYCGEHEGHTKRCSVTKFGAPEQRADYSPNEPAFIAKDRDRWRAKAIAAENELAVQRGAKAAPEVPAPDGEEDAGGVWLLIGGKPRRLAKVCTFEGHDEYHCIGCCIEHQNEEHERLRAQTNAEPVQGHGEPCYYCGGPCNGLTGDPGWWPVGLCHPDDPGVVKWHHESCVTERLHRTETAALASVRTKLFKLDERVMLAEDARDLYDDVRDTLAEILITGELAIPTGGSDGR